jgi:hypothetical protein
MPGSPLSRWPLSLASCQTRLPRADRRQEAEVDGAVDVGVGAVDLRQRLLARLQVDDRAACSAANCRLDAVVVILLLVVGGVRGRAAQRMAGRRRRNVDEVAARRQVGEEVVASIRRDLTRNRRAHARRVACAVELYGHTVEGRLALLEGAAVVQVGPDEAADADTGQPQAGDVVVVLILAGHVLAVLGDDVVLDRRLLVQAVRRRVDVDGRRVADDGVIHVADLGEVVHHLARAIRRRAQHHVDHGRAARRNRTGDEQRRLERVRSRPTWVVGQAEGEALLHVVGQQHVGGGDIALVEDLDGEGHLALARHNGAGRKGHPFHQRQVEDLHTDDACVVVVLVLAGDILAVLVDDVVLDRRLLVLHIGRRVDVAARGPAVIRDLCEVGQRRAACAGVQPQHQVDRGDVARLDRAGDHRRRVGAASPARIVRRVEGEASRNIVHNRHIRRRDIALVDDLHAEGDIAQTRHQRRLREAGDALAQRQVWVVDVATGLVDLIRRPVVVGVQARLVEGAFARLRVARRRRRTEGVEVVAAGASRQVERDVHRQGVRVRGACRQAHIVRQRPRGGAHQRAARRHGRDEAGAVDRQIVVKGRLIHQVIPASGAATVEHRDRVIHIPRAVGLPRRRHKTLVVRDVRHIAAGFADLVRHAIVVPVKQRLVEAAFARLRIARRRRRATRVDIVAARTSRQVHRCIHRHGVDVGGSCRQILVIRQRPRPCACQCSAQSRRCCNEAGAVDRQIVVERRPVDQIVLTGGAAVVEHVDAVDQVPGTVRLLRHTGEGFVVSDVGQIATRVGSAAWLPRLRQRHPVEQTLVRRAVRRRQTAVVDIVAAAARQVQAYVHRQGVDVARTGVQALVRRQRPRAAPGQRTVARHARHEARTVNGHIVVHRRLVAQRVDAARPTVVVHRDAVDHVPGVTRRRRRTHELLVVVEARHVATGIGVAARLPRLRQRRPVEQTLVRRAVRRRQTAVVDIVAAPARQVQSPRSPSRCRRGSHRRSGSGSSPDSTGQSRSRRRCSARSTRSWRC